MMEIFDRYRPQTIQTCPSHGTWELAKTAAGFGAERLLMISTDRAVNPRSIMGASKRAAELALLARAPPEQRGTQFGREMSWARTGVLARCFSSKSSEVDQ
jgi:hypothetical protein